MAWDPSRPIPWKRLLREAAIFLVIGGLAFALLFEPKDPLASYAGLLIGAALFVGFSAVMAKFGYQRTTLKRARETGRAAAASKQAAASAAPLRSRQRPAPTRRTSTGPSNRPKPKQRRR